MLARIFSPQVGGKPDKPMSFDYSLIDLQQVNLPVNPIIIYHSEDLYDSLYLTYEPRGIPKKALL
jgi:hypothetical protein